MHSRRRGAAIAVALCAAPLSSTAMVVAASAEASMAPTSPQQKLELLTEEAAADRARLADRYPSLQCRRWGRCVR